MIKILRKIMERKNCWLIPVTLMLFIVLISFCTSAVNAPNIGVWTFDAINPMTDSLGLHDMENHSTTKWASSIRTTGRNTTATGSLYMNVTPYHYSSSKYAMNLWVYPRTVGSTYQVPFSLYDGAFNAMRMVNDYTIYYDCGATCSGTVTYNNFPIKNNSWNMITLLYNGSQCMVLLDGTNRSSVACTGAISLAATLQVGCSYDITKFWEGGIDEVYLWSNASTPSLADFLTLYNAGAGTFYPFSGAANNLSVNSIVLRNTSNAVVTTLTAYDLFKVAANVTFNDVYNSSVACEYNASNIWEQFPNYGNNQTFYNTNFTANFTTYGATGAVNDTYEFRICKVLSGNPEVRVYVNGSLVKNISSVNIPSCSIGVDDEIVNVSGISYSTTQRLDLNCFSGCNVVNTVRVVSFGRNTTALLNRNYAPHRETLYSNATSGLYEDSDYGTHYFSNSGNNSLSVNCSYGTNISSLNNTYNVGTYNVTAMLNQLQVDGVDYGFSNGTLLESGTSYSILGDCYGGTLTLNKQMNLTYGNGTLISNVTEEYMNISKMLINENGAYNVSLSCIARNSSNVVRKWFNVTDSTIPTLTMVTPSSANTTSIYTNSTLTMDFVGNDVNLYKLNVSCVNSLGVNVLNTEVVTYPTTPAEFLNYSSIISVQGNVTCHACAYDAHTKQAIPDIDYVILNNSVSFEYGKSVLTVTYEDNPSPDSIEVFKKDDRYVFTPKSKFKTIDVSTLTYTVECNLPLVSINKSKFMSHYLCGDLWIDFGMKGLTKKNYKMTELASDRVRVQVSGTEKLDSWTTESIGIINSMCVDTYVTVVDRPVESTCVTTSLALIFIGFIIMWAVLLGIGLIFEPFAFVAGLLGIAYFTLNPLCFPLMLNIVLISINVVVMAISIAMFMRR